MKERGKRCSPRLLPDAGQTAGSRGLAERERGLCPRRPRGQLLGRGRQQRGQGGQDEQPGQGGRRVQIRQQGRQRVQGRQGRQSRQRGQRKAAYAARGGL